MKNADLVGRIVKLDTFVRTGIPQVGDRDGFLTFPATAKDRDGAYLLVHSTTGQCILVSWLESGHNGDSYGERRNEITEDFALSKLNEVEASLFQRAREMVQGAAKRDQADRERKRLDDATRKAVFGEKYPPPRNGDVEDGV